MKMILYNTLIKPYLEYGIEICGSAKLQLLKKIKRLNRRAIRMVFNKQRKDPINEVMMSNSILSFKMLHKYALLKTGYEIIHKLGPLSITELFRRENPLSRRPFDFRISRLNSTLLKFPQGSIPKEWNVLDESLKTASTQNLFKRKAKLYLLNRQV